MNYAALPPDQADTVKALLEAMTGDPVRLVTIVKGTGYRCYAERWTGSRWVRA